MRVVFSSTRLSNCKSLPASAWFDYPASHSRLIHFPRRSQASPDHQRSASATGCQLPANIRRKSPHAEMAVTHFGFNGHRQPRAANLHKSSCRLPPCRGIATSSPRRIWARADLKRKGLRALTASCQTGRANPAKCQYSVNVRLCLP